MSEVHAIDPARPEDAEKGLAAAASAVARGDLVVVPTETVYGIACRPDDPHATGRVFQAKQRPRGLNLPVLAASAGAAWEIAQPNPVARQLAERFWPGPLTLILPRGPASGTWRLGRADSSVAVRVPDHPLTRALLDRTGPLAATSANLSGRPPLRTREELLEVFGDQVAVYLVLASDEPGASGVASTVVDLTGADPVVVRGGPISQAAVQAVAEGSSPAQSVH
jgi:tRNA threonylcarbamoyl adenosine modification protein (Sua5/YciO/YrdC/YwlC family)